MIDSALTHLVDAKFLLANALKDSMSWDVLISSYNDNQRVKDVFDSIPAPLKNWWILPEYGYEASEGPEGSHYRSTSWNEAELVDEGLASIPNLTPITRLCVDITGFLPQHILYLLKRLSIGGFRSVTFVYTEPESYFHRAETAFSLDDVELVREVSGFGGNHVPDMTNDTLLVGIGYDHRLVARVNLDKESARFIQLQCFPSLSADMYHESLLRLDRVGLTTSPRTDDHVFFSSANDPFVTASVLSSAYHNMNREKKITNLYLSPLATKPQALGFGLFYMRELIDTASSIIYPFSRRHSRLSSAGIGRTWVYPIQLNDEP